MKPYHSFWHLNLGASLLHRFILEVLFWSSREIVAVESGGGAIMRVGVGSGRCGGGYGSCGCSQSE